MRAITRMPLCALVAAAACADSPTQPDVATDDPLVPAAAVGRGNSPNAKACQKDGWQGLVRADGTSFTSEEACTSYAAEGGALYRPQTITFDALGGKTFGDADFSVSATASSGLAVTFSASGNCTVAGSTVHLTGAGSCTITAHQAGDANWLAAPDVSRSFVIARADQTLAFTSTNPSPAPVGGPSYTPAATATSGLIVSFSLDAGSTGCSLTNGVVSFTSVGTCVINADQAGDADWNPAPRQQQSVTTWTGTVFAVAYIDVEDNGGDYDPDKDLLIAKLVDASGDGQPGNGDMVITDVYPTAFDAPWNIRSFTTKAHTVTACGSGSSTTISCLNAGLGTQFNFNNQEDFEGYSEGPISTFLFDDTECVAGLLDYLSIDPLSPSKPVETVDVRMPVCGDNAFLDVDIYQLAQN